MTEDHIMIMGSDKDFLRWENGTYKVSVIDEEFLRSPEDISIAKERYYAYTLNALKKFFNKPNVYNDRRFPTTSTIYEKAYSILDDLEKTVSASIKNEVENSSEIRYIVDKFLDDLIRDAGNILGDASDEIFKQFINIINNFEIGHESSEIIDNFIKFVVSRIFVVDYELWKSFGSCAYRDIYSFTINDEIIRVECLYY